MFLIGDIIYYPVFGAGNIINIEERDVYGEVNRYYIIKLIISGMSIMVPLNYEEDGKIRRAIEERRCEEIFDILKDQSEKLPSKWVERYKYYNLSIKEGDIFKLAEILRDIAALGKLKNLSKSEVKFFEDILNLVSGELSLVLSKDFLEVKSSIKNILN